MFSILLHQSGNSSCREGFNDGIMRLPLFGLLPICYLILVNLNGILCSTLYQWIVDSQTRFNYDPDPTNMLGVYNWPRTYSTDCAGLHQSPVDIQLNQVRYGVSCRCPRLIYSNNLLSGTLKNNGHSAEFEPESEMMLQITNVPYRDGTYKMHDFHLHYGGVSGRNFELQGRRFRGSGIMSAGSEHTIDGLRFEGELHFVFYNSKYRNLEEADDKADGVVVIVMLIQKLPMMMSGTIETSRFSEFLETNIPQIFPYQYNHTTEVDLTIFFNRSCEFYTYPGSTTTPTCHESVRWIILKDPLTVTERAWFQLTGLQSRGDFNSRFGNYRTTQPLNDRVVEANFERPSESVLPSATGESALMMMMMSVLMNMMNMTSQDLVDIMGANRVDVARFSNLAENIRNMPMIAMNRNDLVPNLNSNLQEMRAMTLNAFQTPVDSMRNMQQMVTNRDALVPNLDGNIRNMPMMAMTRGGPIPRTLTSRNMMNEDRMLHVRNLANNIQNMMTTMENNPTLSSVSGNIRMIPMSNLIQERGQSKINPGMARRTMPGPPGTNVPVNSSRNVKAGTPQNNYMQSINSMRNSASSWGWR